MNPVGYFGLSTANPLIKDMTESWGDCLESMETADTLWLLARTGVEAYLENPSNVPPSENAYEVFTRLAEVSYDEKQQLIRALCDKNHPVGYFSLPVDHPLIADMTETWGQNLRGMHENDTIWLISKLADSAWDDQEDGVSSEAEEARDRLYELSYQEKLMLIQALAQ